MKNTHEKEILEACLELFKEMESLVQRLNKREEEVKEQQKEILAILKQLKDKYL